jgi:hypothetical protein
MLAMDCSVHHIHYVFIVRFEDAIHPFYFELIP